MRSRRTWNILHLPTWHPRCPCPADPEQTASLLQSPAAHLVLSPWGGSALSPTSDCPPYPQLAHPPGAGPCAAWPPLIHNPTMPSVVLSGEPRSSTGGGCGRSQPAGLFEAEPCPMARADLSFHSCRDCNQTHTGMCGACLTQMACEASKGWEAQTPQGSVITGGGPRSTPHKS